MADPSAKGASTFSVARNVVTWARGIDPSINVLEDDVMPLCIGPMRKVLTFSMLNFKKKSDINQASKAVELSNKILGLEEKRRMNKTRIEIRRRIRESLQQQKSARLSLSAAIDRGCAADSQMLNLRDDQDAYKTRERVVQELHSTRIKELEMWARTIHEITDFSQIQTVEDIIVDLKKKCLDVLVSTNKDALQQQTAPVPPQIISSPEVTAPQLRKQTDSELHTSVIDEYLAAARMSFSVTEKLKDKIIVNEENKDIFINALALELAGAERSSLKKIIAEVELSIREMSSAPAELEHQKESSKLLKERTADLKKRIAQQARLNLSLDKKLQEMNSANFQREIEVQYDDSSIESSVKDFSLGRSAYHLSSSGMVDHSAYEEKSRPLPLGCQLDSHVEQLGRALANLSGCWSSQSTALAATTVQSLRRIVPDTATVSSTVDPQGRHHSSSLLDSLVGAAVSTSFQLPLPVDDFSTRQASNLSSSFRVLTTKLGVPSSLSAAASIRSLSAMKTAADYSIDAQCAASEYLNDSSKVAPHSPSSSSSSPSKYDGVRVHEASAILSRAVQNIEDTNPIEEKEAHCYRGSQFSKEEVDNIVSGLNETADRLQECFLSAQTLRRSLHSLKEEEAVTKNALRDYDQPNAKLFA